MSNLKTWFTTSFKTWAFAAGDRALRTVAQTFIASISTAALLSDVEWPIALSASVMAGLLSLATSLMAGLPELSTTETITETTTKTTTETTEDATEDSTEESEEE